MADSPPVLKQPIPFNGDCPDPPPIISPPTIEQRASCYPQPPSQKPTASYWQDPPSDLATFQAKRFNRRSDRIPTTCHTLIIGSGITGATLAYHLLNSNAKLGSKGYKVLMLEARTACSGATGRNGGHTKPHCYREFPSNVAKLGVEEASKIARFKHACFKQQHDFALEHKIDCDSWTGDTVDVFYDEGNWKEARKGVEQLQKALGTEDEAAQYKLWTAEETKDKYMVEGALGAISYPAGSLNAYKFGIGVLKLAIEKGLDLQTGTPVDRICQDHDIDYLRDWRVYTPRGRVCADRVVLATNGYTARLHSELRGTIVPTRGHMTVQRPPSGLPPGTLKGTYSFIYKDGYEYMIPRPSGTKDQGSICIGGGTTKGFYGGLMEYGTTDDTTVDPTIFNHVKASAAEYFGPNWGKDDPKGRILQAWTGIMGYSADGFPLVGYMPHNEITINDDTTYLYAVHNLWIAASFQGSGMVMCFLAAKALSLMMSDKDNDELKEWFPEAYRMGRQRFGHKFQGRLHLTAPKDFEVKGAT